MKRLRSALLHNLRRRSLSVGIVIAMCTGLLLPAVIGGVVLTSLRQEKVSREVEGHIQEKMNLLTSSLVDPVWNVDKRMVLTIAMAALLDNQVVRITIRDQALTTILDLEYPERRLGTSRLARNELVRGAEVLGSVELEIDDGLRQQELAQDRMASFWVLLCQFILALALILIAVRVRVLKPLARLMAFSNQLAGGNLEQPLTLPASDEMGLLAQQMDRMRSGLQASFAEQQAILNNIQVGVLFVRERRVMLANRHAELIFGYAPGAMKDLPVRTVYLTDAQFQSIGREAYAAIAKSAGNYQTALELQRRDGATFLAQMRGSALDPLRPHAGSIWVFEDITERKRSEAQLLLAASVFSHAREGIMITAADGTIIDVNESFTRVTGYSRDEALGHKPNLLKSDLQDPGFYAALWHDLAAKGHWYGEIWNRRKNGQAYPEMLTISAVRNAQGATQHFVALFTDISAIKEHEQRLQHMAHFDVLTALPNRVLLADRLHQAMVQTQRRAKLLAVAYLDLDGFKEINDRYGHDTGDQVLVMLANRMQLTLREGDTLARMGGDEFVAVFLDLPDVATGAPMLRRLLAAAAEPMHIGNLVLQVSASLGVTFFPQADDVDADQLLRQGDQAMYLAKLAGKGRYHVFDADHDRSLRGHHESLEHIRLALAAQEFVLYYQPKVNMRTGTVIGAEALIRWQHPQRGLLPPADFLPVIEDNPLAVAVGEWVIATALTQMERWHAQGLDVPVSVNIGARQLQQVDFVSRLRQSLAAHPGIVPGKLELEVLETSSLEDLSRVSEVIESCREIGVMFALDDFGTGYSSLTYLKRLSAAYLKIDKSFVRDMLSDPDDLAILRGVISLAAAFQRQVIAEGVETVEHGTALLKLGCELAQGYCIARPMPADDFPAWVAAWVPDAAWSSAPTLGT
ncbi:MAG: EAL domain-containing protein [Rhodoferax sp.]|nr:EAL domain-containing protein [Rhodoferax sp.]